MQQYFSNKKENNTLYLNDADLNHIKNVMRMKENDEVLVVHNNTSFVCSLNKDLLSAEIKSIYKENQEREIIAYIPIVQEEKMSFVIEKGTEMGVTKFIPVEFERCKFKLKNEQKEKKLIRWNKIAKEASEQSHRVIKATVLDIIKLDDIILDTGVNLVCSLDKENVKHISEVLNKENICDTINLIYGPEGGISRDEEDLLVKKGFIKTSLGNNVLRTETVLIFLTSVIEYLGGSK